MKKIGLFVISVLLTSLFAFVVSVSAQGATTGLEQVPLVNEVQQGQQTYEQFTAAQNKTSYLTQEWGKIVEKNAILGPIFKVINSVFVFIRPFFKIVLGYDSLSLGFVVAVAIWLALFFLLNPAVSQTIGSGLTGGLASFAIVSLISLSGVIKKAVDLLNTLVTNTWILWISIGVAILLVFIASMFGKQLKNWIKKMKKESEEAKTAQAQKTIQATGKLAEKELESYEEGRPGGY
jgi:hypothetical protein